MFVNWLTDSDSYLLLADNKLDEGDISSAPPVVPADCSFDRSLEARSTPVPTPSRLAFPRTDFESPFRPRHVHRPRASTGQLGKSEPTA